MMQINVKIRNKAEIICYDEVKRAEIVDGYLLISYKKGKKLVTEPMNLEFIEFWEETE